MMPGAPDWLIILIMIAIGLAFWAGREFLVMRKAALGQCACRKRYQSSPMDYALSEVGMRGTHFWDATMCPIHEHDRYSDGTDIV
jgi:hypothetical protein